MADNRKYYYLKLKESYFDDDSIVPLERVQGGAYYMSNIKQMENAKSELGKPFPNEDELKEKSTA